MNTVQVTKIAVKSFFLVTAHISVQYQASNLPNIILYNIMSNLYKT